MIRFFAVVTIFLAFPAYAQVEFDWALIGSPLNDADDTGYGAVDYVFQISKHEVTNAQYAEFLNSVAATDTNGLWQSEMAGGNGGITRSGSSGSFTYDTIGGRELWAVNWVSFYDSLRFANWLHNGQPTGAQDNSTTEAGAYTITQTGIDDNSIERELGATYFVTSEDEWYKAAYYDELSVSYFDYPAGSDTQTSCTMAPDATANTANCLDANSGVVDVESYAGSTSPYGTFDQGGNVFEWIETIDGNQRAHRGGGYAGAASQLAASERSNLGPSNAGSTGGFRVARLPQLVPSLGSVGLLFALVGLIGFGCFYLVRSRQPA